MYTSVIPPSAYWRIRRAIVAVGLQFFPRIGGIEIHINPTNQGCTLNALLTCAVADEERALINETKQTIRLGRRLARPCGTAS
jgi:hypothetical protein